MSNCDFSAVLQNYMEFVMKFTRKICMTVCCAAAALTLVAASVVSYAYDGASDPLISLSYLLQYKQQEVDPEISALETRIRELENRLNALTQSTLPGTSAPSVASPEAGYQIVQVDAGVRVIATSPCDIMLRSGTAIVVTPYEGQGISDYTEGTELLNGDSVAINHMLLIPREDGRGIQITSATAFIMIRGEFTLVQD